MFRVTISLTKIIFNIGRCQYDLNIASDKADVIQMCKEILTVIRQHVVPSDQSVEDAFRG
jgi:isopropylmalate/homocitrate/citramalate synthase